MRYVDEFRDSGVAREIGKAIRSRVQDGRSYAIMEFCGSHTHTIFRHGVQELLPDNIRLVHGPGCPVCVLPVGRLDNAIRLARIRDVIYCSYGDMLRVPGSNGLSLLKVKAEGADIRMVYSIMNALRIARENPHREVIFFAIGFETTTPHTATAIKQAKGLELANFSVFCNHVLTPSAVVAILESPEVRDYGTVKIDGFIGPGHVSTVIGSQPYEYFAREYQKPVVIAGFEPLDVMEAILMLVQQINEERAEVENEYSRAVTRHGNEKAKSLVAEVFELRKSFEWRGLGIVPYSGLRIKKDYSHFDAEMRFDLVDRSVPDHKACECGAVLRGVLKPTDCKVFGTACTPDSPLGTCMVSAEGACAAYYKYRRYNVERASA